jgi:hypothetical protein
MYATASRRDAANRRFTDDQVKFQAEAGGQARLANAKDAEEAMAGSLTRLGVC